VIYRPDIYKIEICRQLKSCKVASGFVKIAIEDGVFLVDLPIENGDFP
jgi:hypothetical protein